MTSTLHLTPAAAGRLYSGPRFHRARQPADKLIREQIRKFKASTETSMRYLGHILEAIANLKPQKI